MAACAELASAGGIFYFYFYLCLLSFNALIGKHDVHGKNFSLLYKGRNLVLAPFYDLLSSVIYPQLTPKMAMKVGSKYKFSELEARHWEQFAEESGLAKAATRKRLQQLAKELPAAARKLQAAPSHGFAGNAMVEQIVQLIEQRCALTLRRLLEHA
ncbi:HipA protein [Comamonas testosteroni]|nr:HipA protein [Comamonas testosteroni]